MMKVLRELEKAAQEVRYLLTTPITLTPQETRLLEKLETLIESRIYDIRFNVPVTRETLKDLERQYPAAHRIESMLKARGVDINILK